MSTVLRADEKGNLVVPPSLLPRSEPLGSYRVESSGGKVVIAREPQAPKEPELLWKLSSEERVKAFREWIANLPPGPGLSNYDVSRDSICK